MSEETQGLPPSSRRDALKWLGAAVAVAASAPAASASGDSLRARLDAIVRLRGCLDPRPVYIWMMGRRYAVTPDGQSLPLCAVRNCSVTRWERVGDDAFDLTVLEYNYNTDFASGEWRDALVMPITGRSVPMSAPRAEVVRHRWSLRYAFDGRLADAHEFSPAAQERYGAEARLVIDRSIHGPDLLAGEVAYTQDWFLRIQPQADRGSPWFVREVATVRGAAREATDRRRAYVPSKTSYSIAYGFQPWMQLEGVSGHVHTAGYGSKALAAAELPASIHDLLAAKNPEALGDPERLLRG